LSRCRLASGIDGVSSDGGKRVITSNKHSTSDNRSPPQGEFGEMIADLFRSLAYRDVERIGTG
jgi:hypothetical protein